jgi:hypothetical protein
MHLLDIPPCSSCFCFLVLNICKCAHIVEFFCLLCLSMIPPLAFVSFAWLVGCYFANRLAANTHTYARDENTMVYMDGRWVVGKHGQI